MEPNARDRRKLLTQLRYGVVGSALAIGCGLLLWLIPHPKQSGLSPADNALARFSFDLPLQFVEDIRLDDLHIITMDESAYRGTGTPYGAGLERGMLAKLVEQLHQDGCGLIVFDVWLAQAGPPEADRALAAALERHGRVVLAAELEMLSDPATGAPIGERVVPPHGPFMDVVGTNWGISRVPLSADSAIRRHFPGTLSNPSLPWAAALAAGASITTNADARFADRWIRYYGRSVQLASMGYQHTTNQLPNFFKDKTVFIGGRPNTRPVGEKVDILATPDTRISGAEPSPGVEIQATIFLNLVRGDWLRRFPWVGEFLVWILAGMLLGFGLCLASPRRGGLIAVGSIVFITLAGIALPLFTQWWFAWAIVAAGQIPCAWAWSVFAHMQQLTREKASLERKLARGQPQPDPSPSPRVPPDGPTIPLVPDHALLTRIGEGAFGEVWLGRNPVGLYHAVKIVYRRSFDDSAPYEREFHGIRNFMPFSLEHPGWVRVLHVGRNDEAGFFHYVMELGDNLDGAHPVNPATFAARTLETDRRIRKRLPLQDCVELGLQLAGALQFLHSKQLVHRDIKPGNVIFVNGRPKFADIGLVTEMRGVDETRTFTGSRGYMAPDGSGTAVADVFSLGRLLYVMSTGLAPEDFPVLPQDLGEQADVPGIFLMNDILLKACDPDSRRRFQSAEELREALQRLKERLQK